MNDHADSPTEETMPNDTPQTNIIELEKAMTVHNERLSTELPAHATETAHATADAIEACNRSAEVLRSQAATVISIAKTIETEAAALALDIENRGRNLADVIASFSELAKQQTALFETERARYDQIKLPEGRR